MSYNCTQQNMKDKQAEFKVSDDLNWSTFHDFLEYNCTTAKDEFIYVLILVDPRGKPHQGT